MWHILVLKGEPFVAIRHANIPSKDIVIRTPIPESSICFFFIEKWDEKIELFKPSFTLQNKVLVHTDFKEAMKYIASAPYQS